MEAIRKDCFGYTWSIDLTKSRIENARAAIIANGMQATEQRVRAFTESPEPFWAVRDLLEKREWATMEDAVKAFWDLYPEVHADWGYALQTGLLYVSQSTVGNFYMGTYKHDCQLAKQIRAASWKWFEKAKQAA